MAEHTNLKQYTEGKEDLMQQAIYDYLMTDATCFFKPPKYKLKNIISNIFDNLSYANGPDFAGDTEFQGDFVKGGMVYNFISAFKKLFILTRNQYGKINLDELPKADLQDAYDMLHSGMESYGVLIAKRNHYYKNMDVHSYTLGAFANDIINRLTDRCRFEDIDTMSILKGLIRSAQLWRNEKDHANADKSYLWTHIYGMMMFMCASEYCSYLIRDARFGGVRYETRVPGKVVFHANDKEIYRMTVPLGKSSPQFTPVYQFNLPCKWQEGMDCRIEFYSSEGKMLDSRKFTVMGNNFCTFKYKSDQDTTQNIAGPVEEPKEPDQSPRPRLLSTINIEKLKFIPFLSGRYFGKTDENAQPHGNGIFYLKGNKYEGAFEHGKPCGVFTVHSDENFESFMFIGELADDFTPSHGTMTYLKDDKVYEGDFEGWGLKRGKKFKAGKLVYEGDFEVITDTEGVIYVLYHGKGTLCMDEGTYEGEFVYGVMSGFGKMTYIDGRPSVYGRWSSGVLAKEYPMPEVDTQSKPADEEPAPGVEQQTLQREPDSEPTPTTVLVLLNLPSEPIIIRDADGNELPIPDDDAMIELFPGMSVSACLLSDERAVAYFKASDIPGMLVQWDVAGELEKIVQDLPPIVYSGTIELENGTYTGEWNKYKLPHGLGKLVMSDGQIYMGEFKDGKYDGQGELVMLRQTYSGGFKEGVYHGFGTTRLKNGDLLEGTYVNGLKDGEFTHITFRGLVRKTYWKMGELVS